jgi:UTP-glucose-1-phosphate uridylyltransferase
MEYKFCILAAGRGTRNSVIKNIHKGLLPLENKSIISHIINKVPEEIEIVIAIGYYSDQIKDYLKLVFPDKKITYVYVENFDGIGSGPGLSLLKCREELQCPFIFTACDTLIDEDYNFLNLNQNWIGVSHVNLEDCKNYCLVDKNKNEANFYYGEGDKAFIGMAGIYDYKTFWKNLANVDTIHNEHQVINGFKNLKNIEFKFLTWHDTGNVDSYIKTRAKFTNELVAFKNNEALYSENGKIIKFFSDSSILNDRVARCNYLNNTNPIITKLNDNFYYYDFINGDLLSSIQDEAILEKVIPYWFEKLGSNKKEITLQFLKDCELMYKTKTINRCQPFANTYIDSISYINGIYVDSINNMLQRIDWEGVISNSIPSNFHGDFQPENIIWDGSNFKLIDWRQNFGSDISYGDFYYDLGKMYHALLINGEDVHNKMYKIIVTDTRAEVSHHIRNNLNFLFKELKYFCKENNLSWDKVELLGTLQYLGISTLYENYQNGEYGKFLFLYGKYLLAKYLNKQNKN